MSASLKTITYGLNVSLERLLIRVFFFTIPFYLYFSISYCQQQASFPISAQALKFERISPEHGISSDAINSILQDSKGFMWFGTQDGLNRFDGYSLVVYKPILENPNSLSSNYIRSIYEDRSGVIWIGTNDGGLNRFDREKQRFIRYLSVPNDPNSLSSNAIRAIYEDHSGVLWIGTFGGGLNKLVVNADSIGQGVSREKVRFIHYQHDPKNPHSLSNNYVTSIYESRSGGFWIGTDGGGLNKFDHSAERFIHYQNDPNDPYSLSHDRVYSIHEDRLGVLWIGTNGGGLNKFDHSTERFTHYQNDPHDPYSLNSDIIWSIYEDDSGALWVGTFGGGLNRFVPPAMHISESIEDAPPPIFIHYKFDPNDPHSLSYNDVISIYQDRQNVLWIGTAGGVSKLDPQKRNFRHYRYDPDDPNSLSDNMIRAIYEDRSGLLWIGTNTGGLNKLDQERHIFSHYKNDPNDSNSLNDNSVWSIYEDRHEILWIGTFRGGLNKFDRKKEKFFQYQFDPGDPYSLSNNFVSSIYEDQSGVLWIGTRYGGLNKFDGKTGRFFHYQHNPDDPNSISDNGIRAIYEDHEAALWIGTYDGLNKFDRSTGEFINYKNDPNKQNSLSHNIVSSIYEDQSRILWIATFGGGLNRFDREKETFASYTEKDGLPDNVVYGVLEDNIGNLWLSTNKGISKFNPQTETFRNYDAQDGLQNNEFNLNALFKNSSGEMFFGGINGFNAFYPHKIKDNPYVPPMVITDFQIFNKPVEISDDSPLKADISETNEIILSYRHNVISFEFAALNFTNSEKNQYKYIMEGFDSDWIDSGTRRFVTYTNLDPGEYIFRVKGTNNDGIWNEEGASVRIIITPPFWQTWWFRILVILSILLSGYTWYKRRINKLELKKKELEERVEERTEAATKLQNALDQVEHLKNQLQAENVYLQDEIKIVHNFEYIISRSEVLKKVLNNVEKVASTDATVLILGESGTGKELVARAVHNISNRADRPLVKINCSALPESLIESELFGHEKGAFTGAISQKIGRFELANGGTIFLDEIGDLPLELQTKLLRVLQEGEFERIGNPKTVKVDVRVIAATNRDLEEAIRNGNFREDLYYRLNVFPIIIPPLRERKEDIPLLVKHFMEKYSARAGKQMEVVSQNLIDKLQAYDWPGNVRELENIIERAVIISEGKKLKIGDWLPTTEPRSEDSDIPTLEQLEKKHILEVLELTGWRIRGENGAARILNLKPTTLASRMAKLGIKRSH